MKKRRSYKFSALLPLYSGFVFQKATFLVFVFTLFLMTLSIYFLSNPWLPMAEYAQSWDDFHALYFQQSLLILQIFNSILTAVLSIFLGIQAKSFDILFISHVSRRKICCVKLITAAGIGFLLCLYELVLVVGIAFLRYSRFIPDQNCFFGFGYIYLSFLFEYLWGILLTTLLPIIFVPMSGLCLSLILRIVVNNSPSAAKNLSAFFPVLQMDKSGLSYGLDYPYLIAVWIVLLFFLYICIYDVRDIR